MTGPDDLPPGLSGRPEPPPENAVVLQPLCRAHRFFTVHDMALSPDGPWQIAIMCVSTLLFARSTADAQLNRRIGEEDTGPTRSLVLAEVGCLACRYSATYEATLKIIRRPYGACQVSPTGACASCAAATADRWHAGFTHAFAVLHGKESDPDWSAEWQPKEPPREVGA